MFQNLCPKCTRTKLRSEEHISDAATGLYYFLNLFPKSTMASITKLLLRVIKYVPSPLYHRIVMNRFQFVLIDFFAGQQWRSKWEFTASPQCAYAPPCRYGWLLSQCRDVSAAFACDYNHTGQLALCQLLHTQRQ